ncbi:twin transmembrane helix small protein [Paramylibacter ulvae]|uniref:twin transmembrane helix small protein n=1 Tax=Paramylibacter ulvae TaxID=1651968 RepID=UPI0016784DF4|nr:twin transmembrane helix small protein [Amylibacter ulvae]
MSGFYYLIIIACLAVLAVLMLGLGSFTSGGEFNRKYANKIMRWRIILQAIAVILIIIYAIIRSSGNA